MLSNSLRLSQLYPTTEGPHYIKGQAVTLGLLCFSAIVFTVMWFCLNHINRQRDEGKRGINTEGMTEEQIAELGDDSPRFRYTV